MRKKKASSEVKAAQSCSNFVAIVFVAFLQQRIRVFKFLSIMDSADAKLKNRELEAIHHQQKLSKNVYVCLGDNIYTTE
jgi:hypothetical protein